jgi:hypothetical protein
MIKRVFFLASCPILLALIATGPSVRATQDEVDLYKSDSCVKCHSHVTSPMGMANRYLDWHLSAHKYKGVGCEKCHGGDSSVQNENGAHMGILPPDKLESRLHAMNLPDTCGSCHKPVVDAFVKSVHYQRLKLSGMGPSCNTCHAHMASIVIRSPEEAAALCARCHDAINGLMARRPEIPARAEQVMQALKRANSMVVWANSLVDEAGKKKLDIGAQGDQMKAAIARLTTAKVGWHAFNLDSTEAEANAAFELAVKVKDRLMKRLGYA